jgi:Ca2+-transporting ATPase
MMHAYKESIENIIDSLQTNRDAGLSEKEAAERLKKFGKNAIESQSKQSAFFIFLAQFTNPLIGILFFAAFASVLIGDYKDALVIILTALLNALLGFIQEWKAEQTMHTLLSYDVLHGTVIRDSQKKSIPAENLVRGDVLFLRAGDKVPADLRLIQVTDCIIDESILTGESHAVEKKLEPILNTVSLGDQHTMAFKGTLVLKGKAYGIVTATGKDTELGKIAHLVQSTTITQTPIQKQLHTFSKLLSFGMFALIFIILSVGFVRLYFSASPTYTVKELIALSIALMVAAIPEGLLLGVTVVLSVALQRMYRKKALIKKLFAAEGLGSVSVICTDKTGTITEGSLSVVSIITLSYEESFALELATLSVDASIEPDGKKIGEPTEIALLQKAASIIDYTQLQKKYPRIAEIPFSSEYFFGATVHTINGTQRLIVKGVPEVIMQMCSLSEKEKQQLETLHAEMVKKGLRITSVAYKDHETIDIKNDLNNLSFVATFGLQDKLRDTTQATLQELHKAGIHTVLITGDHIETARIIGKKAGISLKEDDAITGASLQEMSEEVLAQQVEHYTVVARAAPADKVRIIQAWQARKHFVAMLGEGINDAPAIRAADIGIVLESGADLTKEIADIILLDNNLERIKEAVYQGRIVFDNIRKITAYLLIDSFSEIMLIGTAILFNLPSPLNPLHIIWINLISDGPPYMALAFEPGEPGITTEKPRDYDEPIVNSRLIFLIFFIGVITDVGLLALYLYYLQFGHSPIHNQTVIFTALALDSLLYVFSIRTLRSTIFHSNPLKNKYMIPACLLGFAIQLAVIYVPFLQNLFGTVALGYKDWIFILPLAFIKIIFIEITKAIQLKYYEKK